MDVHELDLQRRGFQAYNVDFTHTKQVLGTEGDVAFSERVELYGAVGSGLNGSYEDEVAGTSGMNVAALEKGLRNLRLKWRGVYYSLGAQEREHTMRGTVPHTFIEKKSLTITNENELQLLETAYMATVSDDYKMKN